MSSPGKYLLHWCMLSRCRSATFTNWWMTVGRGSSWLLQRKSDCLRRIVEETSTIIHSFIHSLNDWLDWLISYSVFCSPKHFLNVQYMSGTQLRYLRKSRSKKPKPALEEYRVYGGDKMLKIAVTHRAYMCIISEQKNKHLILGKTSSTIQVQDQWFL